MSLPNPETLYANLREQIAKAFPDTREIGLIVIADRPSDNAHAAVVPLPRNGSSTTPPTGHPALMHGSTSPGGITAK